ncbi:MAG: hypothetical protein ACJ8FS_02285 [Sphingomicrobium sp.]
MSSFGKRVDFPGGRRRIKRRPVRIFGSIETSQGLKLVVIKDLCLIGAKLAGRNLPGPGEEILLRAGERTIFGRIAWADKDRRGITFGVLPRSMAA